jgi:predicted dehydrogenase
VKETVGVGIIGTGNIFPAYVRGCRAFDVLEIVACADVDVPKARAQAVAFDIPKPCEVEELLADPTVQIVVNLTIPVAHAQVSLAAIDAGKHLYSEKPLAVNRAVGAKILAAAREQGVRVGCAPDTFLGGGNQTCRKLIDDGWIGEPVATTAFMVCHGHESWHPNPDFYYQIGGGPMLDMGPYYLTGLINLLGPAVRVTGATRRTFPERIPTSERNYGRRIRVEVDTHVAGVLNFDCGAIGTIITSFDVWHANLPNIEVYGSTGSLVVPHPNGFGGPVRLRRAGADGWSEIPLTHSAEVSRGIGVADMAYGIIYNRPHRANGEVAYHVLDVMQAFEEASRSGQHVRIASRCSRPAPLPLSLMAGELDTGA